MLLAPEWEENTDMLGVQEPFVDTVFSSPRSSRKGSHQHLGSHVTKAYKICFSEHAKTSYHQKCSELPENFLRVAQGQKQHILNQLSNERARQGAENQVIIGSIVDTIILCGRQEVALTGNHDAGTVNTQATEINYGNFRCLLRFCVQAGGSMRLQTKKTVEQLSLCFRWLDVDENKIHEEFLSFNPVKDLTGQGIAETIIAALKHHGIHDDYLIGQGYDDT
ncbi:hypothetical protein PR048_013597 [Dryococelus australis]|uniref:Uncharacterized protein n=1 Tax=Dryococelus australis TaxID=614101 RepID=A0ABQ9HSM7_9NEOP|nr:hypothetical protein PR048_013597 [Dryococelus australis]